MKKSILICAALTMIASVGYADTKDFVIKNNIIFEKSHEKNYEKLVSRNNVIGGINNIIDDPILDIVVKNKNKKVEEIKDEISKELSNKYKETGILSTIKENKNKSKSEIINIIKDKLSNINEYDFKFIDTLIDEVKKGAQDDKKLLYSAFDPYNLYNANKIQKVIENKDKEDGVIKQIVKTQSNYLDYNTVLGPFSKVYNSSNSVVIGLSAKAENSGTQGNIAIGKVALATGDATISIGSGAKALNKGAVSLGENAKSLGKYSTAIGSQSYAYGMDSIALGIRSIAGDASKEVGYRPYNLNEEEYKNKTEWIADYGVVSVGGFENLVNKLHTRQIVNVAAGYNDTDAVNVAQLKELKTYVDNSTPFEYATKDNKSLYKYGDKYYYKETNKEYEGKVDEVIIQAKEPHKLSNIKSSLVDGNTTSTGTTPASATSGNGDSVVVINDLKTIKANKADKAYVDEKVAKLNEKTDLALSGVSSAVAMANLPQVSGDRKFNLAASYGYYGGSHAVAVGLSGTNDKQNFTYKLSGSVNSKGNLAFGIGAGVMLGSVNKGPNFEERLNKLEKENQELKEVIKKLMNK
ncbi:YadA-like family protein [uncultured Sneathia sp.]|uniref:YadA family autotransporter adhesin n=1 Tax=uncultured Sneathia sp. TaxID=278067 RepID=UPI0025931182|nr:YadA-like family protein [uncultured Sneathia sp.]